VYVVLILYSAIKRKVLNIIVTIFYQFLHIKIEIIHGSHMYILFLPRVDLYVSFLPLANARGNNTVIKYKSEDTKQKWNKNS